MKLLQKTQLRMFEYIRKIFTCIRICSRPQKFIIRIRILDLRQKIFEYLNIFEYLFEHW